MAETVAKWTPSAWTAEAENALGDLIAGQRARILAEVEAGTSQVFQVSGPRYSGWIALRFEQEPAGIVMRVTALRGSMADGWLADLRKLAKQAGAVGIILNAESAAHVRLYARLGFEVEAAEMRLQGEL